MSKIKLVVCDLDGTLLNDQKRITPYTISVLKKLKERGIKVCYASGRDEQMMSIYSKAIGGCDYLLSNNGAQVTDGRGRVVYEAALEERAVSEILHFLNEHQMVYMMYTLEKMYFTRGSRMLQKRMESYEKLSAELGVPVILNKAGIGCQEQDCKFQDVGKIVAYEEQEEKMQAFIEFLDTVDRVHTESTGYGLQGAFHQGASKKIALFKIMEELHISPEEVSVFGDYDNDASMFGCAGTRVAMGNAVDSLKEMATVIAKSNNEDGVACFLAEEFQIRI